MSIAGRKMVGVTPAFLYQILTLKVADFERSNKELKDDDPENFETQDEYINRHLGELFDKNWVIEKVEVTQLRWVADLAIIHYKIPM